jgi:hypothetical protein
MLGSINRAFTLLSDSEPRKWNEMSGQLEHLLVSGICVVIDSILTSVRLHKLCTLTLCWHNIRHTPEYKKLRCVIKRVSRLAKEDILVIEMINKEFAFDSQSEKVHVLHSHYTSVYSSIMYDEYTYMSLSKPLGISTHGSHLSPSGFEFLTSGGLPGTKSHPQ